MSGDFIGGLKSILHMIREPSMTVSETRPLTPVFWQDISTAPQDGTTVLLFADGEVCMGQYEGPSDSRNVTRWMPLPLPPNENE
jgi:hypothetical protein